jgi:hypothetical protein
LADFFVHTVYAMRIILRAQGMCDAALSTVYISPSLLPGECTPLVHGGDSPLRLTDTELMDFSAQAHHVVECARVTWSNHSKNYVN